MAKKRTPAKSDATKRSRKKTSKAASRSKSGTSTKSKSKSKAPVVETVDAPEVPAVEPVDNGMETLEVPVHEEPEAPEVIEEVEEAEADAKSDDQSDDADADPEENELNPGDEIGGYTILSRIASGGMGVVYKAEDPDLKRIVALKVVHPQFARDEAYVERIETEAKALARINEPNIVSIYRLVKDQDRVFLAMEFVEGPTLSEIIESDGPLPWERAVPLMKQVLAALKSAHASGVVHGDLKPSNIVVTKNVDGQPLAKLLDFGVAQLPDDDSDDSEETRPLNTIGTLYYMTPEHIKTPWYVDHRSDIFSLAASFYRIMTGRMPFQQEGSRYEIQERIVEGRFDLLETATEAMIPNRLSGVIMKALRTDPQERYQSAAEMLADLEKVGKRPANTRKSKDYAPGFKESRGKRESVEELKRRRTSPFGFTGNRGPEGGSTPTKSEKWNPYEASSLTSGQEAEGSKAKSKAKGPKAKPGARRRSTRPSKELSKPSAPAKDRVVVARTALYGIIAVGLVFCLLGLYLITQAMERRSATDGTSVSVDGTPISTSGTAGSPLFLHLTRSSEVFLDGERQEGAYVGIVPIPATLGAHSVRVRDTETGRIWERTMVSGSEVADPVLIDFTSRFSVQFAAEFEDKSTAQARVILDGNDTGILTPSPIQIPFGRTEIRLEFDGRSLLSIDVTKDNETTSSDGSYVFDDETANYRVFGVFEGGSPG